MSTQKEIDKRIAEVMAEASAECNSSDPLVHIAWIISGLDLWHRSGGKVGHNHKDTTRYVLSHILHMPDENRTE